MATPPDRLASHRKEVREGITGRPPMFTDAGELRRKCEEYFLLCDSTKTLVPDKKTGELTEVYRSRPYTIVGLARHLGFKSRMSLLHYAGKPEFAEVVADARMRIEEQRSEQLIDRSGIPGGIIFDLKNNHGWRDESSVEVSGPQGGPIQLGLASMPPAPKNMDEWVQWYNASNAAKAAPEAIDITPEPLTLSVGNEQQESVINGEVQSFPVSEGESRPS